MKMLKKNVSEAKTVSSVLKILTTNDYDTFVIQSRNFWIPPLPPVYTVYVTNDVLYLIGSDMGLGQADPMDEPLCPYRPHQGAFICTKDLISI
jgi:hypothetical protein